MAFVLAHAAPLPVIIEVTIADPFHRRAEHAVHQGTRRLLVGGGFAHDSEREGDYLLSTSWRSATHFSPTKLQNSPGVISSRHFSNLGCSPKRAQATEPSGCKVVKRTSSPRTS